MSLFIRLSTVAAIAVMLRCVPATLVITAPSKMIDNTAGLETREQDPTAWICSALAVDSPWNAYANIRGYLEGGNAESKDYSNLVLYPVMELYHASKSRLCVYLPAEDHCYPPAPSTTQVKAVKQLTKQNYYAIRFWGQASDARVQYYKQKLTAALNSQSKAANFDLFFVSFFSDHVREVRYDPATTGQGKSQETLQGRPGTCPAGLDFNDSSTTIKLAGQEYLRSSLAESRLSLSDVMSSVVSGYDVKSPNMCAAISSSGGKTAFSFASGVCKLYDLGKQFCPCANSSFDIFINKKQLGKFKELIGGEPELKGVKKLVMYTELPLDNSALYLGTPKNRTQCAAALSADPNNVGAFIVGDQCYVSYLHDFPNCNQTCRGQPVDGFVKTTDQDRPSLPFLSLCEQKISVPWNGGIQSFQPYISHAGLGCYRYQGAKTVEGEDCIVKFERGPNVTSLTIHSSLMSLNYNESTCLDELSIYAGNSTAVASRKYNGCRFEPEITIRGDITIKFHRGLGSEKNIGFKLLVANF